MKYKCLFFITSSGKSGLTESHFYRKTDAISACEQWREQGGDYYAYLWNGSIWAQYFPIP